MVVSQCRRHWLEKCRMPTAFQKPGIMTSIAGSLLDPYSKIWTRKDHIFIVEKITEVGLSLSNDANIIFPRSFTSTYLNITFCKCKSLYCPRYTIIPSLIWQMILHPHGAVWSEKLHLRHRTGVELSYIPARSFPSLGQEFQNNIVI